MQHLDLRLRQTQMAVSCSRCSDSGDWSDVKQKFPAKINVKKLGRDHDPP